MASAVPTVSVILILLPIVNPEKSAKVYKLAPFPKFEKSNVELGGNERVPVVTVDDG